jgi:hypothetical protein
MDMDKVIAEVAQMQLATAHVPAIVAQEVKKAWKQLPNSEPKRGAKSWFHDPLSLQYSLGYKDRKFSLTYETLRRVAGQLSIISAIINTRAAQVAAFTQPFRWTKSLGFTIRHKDSDHATTPAETEFIKELESFILNCGRLEKNPWSRIPRDDFETFIRKIVRDSLIYDQATFEIIPDRLGLPYEFVAVDASTIRLASDDRYVGINSSYENRHGFVPDMPARFAGLWEGRKYAEENGNDPVSFVQVINGQIENVYAERELCLGVRNPRTDIYIQGYGFGELEQLITIVTSHLYAEEYNRKFFSQGSAPKGVINLKGDNYTPEQLEGFRRQWLSQVSGVENCVSGETRIYTKENGFTSIETVCGDSQEVPVRIWTGTSWESGLVYKTKEMKVLCRTSLDNGVVISTSPDHKIRVIGKSGDPEWKTQSELEVGDVVLVNKNDTSAAAQLVCFGAEADTDFMECLGWLLGDGSIGERDVRWFYHHEHEQEIMANHFDVLRRYFPKIQKKVHIRSPEEVARIKSTYGFKTVASTTTMLVLNDVTAVAWLIAHGFSTENRKRIPEQIYTMPFSHRTAYLRGVFSADGNNAKGRSPCITVADDDVRTQVKHLLLSTGVRCSLSEGKTKTTFTGTGRGRVVAPSVLRVKDRDTFFEHIGFLQPHKQPRSLKKLNESAKCDAVPTSTIQKYLLLVRETNAAANYALLTRRERMDLNSILCGMDGCSRPRMLRYLEQAQLPVPAWLTGYNTASVVATENTSTIVPMYDVSVNHEDHMFVGDNVVLSNSWKTPILQSEGFEWTDLNKSNNEMEFNKWIEYLIKISCGVFLIDPAEINFDLGSGQSSKPMFESNQEWKLKASRDRGLKPLLRFIAKMINKNIIDKIDDHFTLEFVGLDELSETEKHEMLVEQISSYMTLNEARRTLDLPDLPGGDVPMNPVYMQALDAQGMSASTDAAQGPGSAGGQDDRPGHGGGPDGGTSPAPGPGGEGGVKPSSPRYSGLFGRDSGESE